MAMGARLVCSHCTRAVEAWSDGNPYYLDEQGNKHYAYHPNHENSPAASAMIRPTSVSPAGPRPWWIPEIRKKIARVAEQGVSLRPGTSNGGSAPSAKTGSSAEILTSTRSPDEVH